MSYLDLDSTCIKTSFYYYLRVIGEVCGEKRVHFDSSSLQRSPPYPSLAFHEVQGRNWQPAMFAQKAVSTQALAVSRAGSWSQVSPGARLSCLHVCAFCGASVGPTASCHGIPETWLTAGMGKHLISCAGFSVLTTSNLVIFKLLQFLHAFFSFFDFRVCVGLYFRVTRSENVLNKHKQDWNKWQPSTCSSLNNSCIYFGDIFILIFFPVLIWI